MVKNKLFKGSVLLVGLTLFIITGYVTYGESKLTSDSVSYSKGDKVMTVKSALDDLLVKVDKINDFTSIKLGINESIQLQSKETATWTSSNNKVASVDNGVVTGKEIGTTVITAKAGDIVSDINVKVDHLSVTKAILDKGTFKNVTPTYLIGTGYNGTDGFTITGAATDNACCDSTKMSPSNFLRWDYKMDLTYVKSIKFYAKRSADYGMIEVFVSDNLDGNYNDKLLYAGARVTYISLPATWTAYELDVSDIGGEHVVSFMGGYTDSSGAKHSMSTSYSNITFEYDNSLSPSIYSNPGYSQFDIQSKNFQTPN